MCIPLLQEVPRSKEHLITLGSSGRCRISLSRAFLTADSRAIQSHAARHRNSFVHSLQAFKRKPQNDPQ